MRKPKAFRLAAELEACPTASYKTHADELRRLYADNVSLIVVNKAYARRQDWWNCRMFLLETERNRLLEALRSIADCCDEEHAARDYASRQTEIRGIARAAIAKVEGQ